MRRIYFATLLAISCLSISYAQNNKNTGRENWFPNRGNVGIGTRTPATDLEVIGDIHATESITTEEFTTALLNATNFSFSSDGTIQGNLTLMGNLGIGVTETQSRLHVLGDIRASQALIAQVLQTSSAEIDGIITVGSTATFNGNAFFNNSVGIGTETPSEKLEVIGNIRASQTIFGELASFTTGSLSGDLTVGGNTAITGGLTSQNISTGAVEMQSFSAAQDGAIQGQLLIDGSVGIGVANPEAKLDVSGDIRAGQSLITPLVSTTDASISNDLSVGSNLSVTNDVYLSGALSIGTNTPEADLHVVGDAIVSQLLKGAQAEFDNAAINQNLNTTGNQTIGGTLEVSGETRLDDNLNVSGVVSGQSLIVDSKIGIGTTTPEKELDVVGNARISGQLLTDELVALSSEFNTLKITDSLNVGGNASVSGRLQSSSLRAGQADLTSLDVNQNAKVGGDLSVEGNTVITGQLTSESISANSATLDSDLEVGGNAGFLGGATVSGNVGIGVEDPIEKLEVAGNIKAESELIATSVSVSESRVTGNSMVGGDESISGNLEVTGLTKSSRIETTQDVSVGDNLTVEGDAEIKGQLISASVSMDELVTNSLLVNDNGAVSGDFVIAGDLGIGITETEARLHVMGDIKSSDALISESLTTNTATVNSELKVGGKADFLAGVTVAGNAGIGVAAPSEKLEVAGSIKAENQLLASKLDVDESNVSGNSQVGGNQSITGELTVTSTAQFGNQLTVAGSLTGQQASFAQSVGIGTSTPAATLDVVGDAQISGLLTTDRITAATSEFENLDITNALAVGGAATVTGNTSISGTLSVGLASRFENNATIVGKLGIGTDTPSDALHVTGNIRSESTIYGNSLEVANFNATTMESLYGSFSQDLLVGGSAQIMNDLAVGVATAEEQLHVGGNIKTNQSLYAEDVEATTASVTTLTSTEAEIETLSSTSATLGNAAMTTATVDELTVNNAITVPDITVDDYLTVNSILRVPGNVGIGVSNPVEKLEIDGNLKVSGNIIGNVVLNTISAESGDINGNLLVNGTLTAGRIQTLDGSPISFSNNLQLSNDSKLGIGASVPEGYKLAVSGAVISTGFDVKRVDRWPDYVFTADYQRRSLEETEIYIQENGHLPDVPSAEEVQENGYSLTEMDKILLQKIEELTLELIELKKQNQSLKALIEESK